MARIRFVPWDRTVEAEPGWTVLEAARAAQVPLGAACDGDGICGACAVQVLVGAPTKEGSLERRTKHANGVRPTLRLACLMTTRKPLTVTTDYWGAQDVSPEEGLSCPVDRSGPERGPQTEET